MLRKESDGIAIIISPLRVLMSNQVEMANKFNLNIINIDADVAKDAELMNKIYSKLENKEVDALIVSPERLGNIEFQERVLDKYRDNIIFFVVDEAHCISDWGHDFRPDYMRIRGVIDTLPSGVPILATTATADDVVVEDIKEQLGEDIFVSRGSLMREGLGIQVIKLDRAEKRLAWITKNIDKLLEKGSGIIYCLTIKDCEMVKRWLDYRNVSCEVYTSKQNDGKGTGAKIAEAFINNEIKVLIATTAFGMGYDKSDIGFVIHFQKPGDLVSYYQQIGRAGRAIKESCAVLFCGAEDDHINEYFINTAFPTERQMKAVYDQVAANPNLTEWGLQSASDLNLSNNRLKGCIKYLCANGIIKKVDLPDENKKGRTKKGYRIEDPDHDWKPDMKKSDEISARRRRKLKEMNEFVDIKTCYMEFVEQKLDDKAPEKCGCCANCMGRDILEFDSSIEDEAQRVLDFFKNDEDGGVRTWPIKIRARYPDRTTIPKEERCKGGQVLVRYGSGSELGREVVLCKEIDNEYSEALVNVSVDFLKRYVNDNEIEWVTGVPSVNQPHLVSGFAEKVAEKLGLPYVESLKKQEKNTQSLMNNSAMKYNNANESYSVIEDRVRSGNVLLIDGIVDSGWTFTVCGMKLLRAMNDGQPDRSEVFLYALMDNGPAR